MILIAPEFDEEAVVHCLCQMRRGTAVDLVGNPANWVNGASGLAVHLDYPLAQLIQGTLVDSYSLLIIPGSSFCATTLLSDPRVHQALKRRFVGGGVVAAMSAVAPKIVANSGLLELANSCRFLVQGTQSTSDFVKIANRCAFMIYDRHKPEKWKAGMRTTQRYASFIVRFWCADNLDSATTFSEPLRGQIIHVQSDHSGDIQTLEQIKPFIQVHLLGSHSPNTTDENTITVEDNRGITTEEDNR